MRWKENSGQAAVEAALVIPLIVVLLLLTFSFGYAVLAQLLVTTSAGQGARQGAMLCADAQPAAVVLDSAREKALALLKPLAGPKDATASFAGQDLVVMSSFTYAPLFPGARTIFGDSLIFSYTARYRCN